MIAVQDQTQEQHGERLFAELLYKVRLAGVEGIEKETVLRTLDKVKRSNI